MSGLRARIIRLERHVPTGPEAELRELSDAELEQRLEATLCEMSEEDVRALAREHPKFYTPERLEAMLARLRRLRQNIEDKYPTPTGSARAR